MHLSFRRIFLFFFLFLFVSFISYDIGNAKVYFIDKYDSVSSTSNQKPCQLGGYKLRAKDCTNQGKKLSQLCPTDASYGKTCACDAKFKYDATNCTGGKNLTGEQCGGKYENCGCNESIYKWNSASCVSPKLLTGNQCNNNPDGGPNSSLKILYDTCSCPSTYTACTSDKVGSGTTCNDGQNKYSSCLCNSTFVKCDNGGASGSSTCTDSQGTKYTSCKQEVCPAGTVDVATYFEGNLKYFANVNNYVSAGSKKCVTLPTCESLGYSSSYSCVGQKQLNCPFDATKIYCPSPKAVETCGSTVTCSYGCKSTCGGKCVECYPACTVGYTYNFSVSECYFRPYKLIYQPTNPNCGSCECDNSLAACGGKACVCAYI
ncbi:MAG: hypothetical protein ACK5N8_04100 [Alphaproteobacteria bacterium]